MSTVFDVTTVTVDGGPALNLSPVVTTVTITDGFTIPTVTLEAPQTVDTLTVEVPGIQGPPGDRNIYTQLSNPAIDYSWGPEDAGKVWIEVNV